MGGRAVEVEVVLLDVLTVVALGVGQPEHPLLQQRVAAVPQRQREAEPLLVVAEAGDAVLAPPVRAGARLIVREVGPGIAAGTVVLPHRAPLTLAQVRPRPAPRHPRLLGLGQPSPLRVQSRTRPGLVRTASRSHAIHLFLPSSSTDLGQTDQRPNRCTDDYAAYMVSWGSGPQN